MSKNQVKNTADSLYTKKEFEYVIRLSDIHAPYEDNDAVSIAIKFCKFIQPKVIVIDELVDCYSISSYDRDPARKQDLQNDVDHAYEILRRIRKSCPKTRIVYIPGNHEQRLLRYLNNKAEELSNLRCLDWRKLLRLSELKIEMRDEFMYKGILHIHGTYVRSDSEAACKLEFRKHVCSGISAHLHRPAVYYKKVRKNCYVWVSNGCLCKTSDVWYGAKDTDWINGINITGFIKGSSHYYTTLLPILGSPKKLVWGRRVFTVGK